MTKKEIKKQLIELAKKDLKKRGFYIGQKVSFCCTDGYILTNAKFADIDLKEILVRVEKGYNWHEVNLRLGYIKPEQTQKPLAKKQRQIDDRNET